MDAPPWIDGLGTSLGCSICQILIDMLFYQYEYFANFLINIDICKNVLINIDTDINIFEDGQINIDMANNAANNLQIKELGGCMCKVG